MHQFTRSKVVAIFACLGGLFLSVGQATAGVPSEISYQAYLTDGSGTPLNGPYNLNIRIYDVETGGTELWHEVYNGVTVTDGRVNISLGSAGSPLNAGYFDGTERWLGVTINSDPELTPRSKLVSVPYAFIVETVDGAAGGRIYSGSVDPWGHARTGLVLSKEGADAHGRSTSDSVGIFMAADTDDYCVIYSVVNDTKTNLVLRTEDNPDDHILLMPSGNVGIKMENPTAALHVGGTPGVDGIRFPDGTLQTSAASGGGGGGGWVDDGTKVRLETGSDNVGIGTSSPAEKLHVMGNARIHSGGYSTDLALYYGNRSWPDATGGAALEFYKDDGVFPTYAPTEVGRIYVKDVHTPLFDPAPVLHINDNVSNDVVLALGGGDVGIGKIPSTDLDIDGSVRIDGDAGGALTMRDGSVTTTVSIAAQSGTLQSPEGSRMIMYDHSGNMTVFIDAEDGYGNPGSIVLYDLLGAQVIKLDAEHGTGGSGRITTPVLEITGGSDLSEQFDLTSSGSNIADPLPGMVVCIDPENPGALTLSTSAYDPTVAGILSGAGGVAPGMLMGHTGTVADGQYPVALSGRVYCMVDASHGAIQPGDMLTTSDVPGHAMKVADHERAYGTVIGKAMSSLESGRGLVLVLVNLQ